jgi:NAD(P)-dependent dehydrogenase (short-subunit alcohol dehydrogenase family)
VKRVLIVGASRGIGLEFVRQYRQAGAEVVATARSEAGLADLRALGATALALDVDSPGAVSWAGAKPFDTAVLVAGVFGPRSSALEPPTAAEFDAVMHTNVLAAMHLLPQMADALAAGGRLAAVSSRMGSIGLRTSPGGWLYRASKAALNSVLKDVSLVHAGRAVCVALHPGWVRTDMGGGGADLDVADSVAGMRRTLAALGPADNGGFYNFDGAPLAW